MATLATSVAISGTLVGTFTGSAQAAPASILFPNTKCGNLRVAKGPSQIVYLQDCLQRSEGKARAIAFAHSAPGYGVSYLETLNVRLWDAGNLVATKDAPRDAYNGTYITIPGGNNQGLVVSTPWVPYYRGNSLTVETISRENTAWGLESHKVTQFQATQPINGDFHID
jgi:hypothetical protein